MMGLKTDPDRERMAAKTLFHLNNVLVVSKCLVLETNKTGL